MPLLSLCLSTTRPASSYGVVRPLARFLLAQPGSQARRGAFSVFAPSRAPDLVSILQGVAMVLVQASARSFLVRCRLSPLRHAAVILCSCARGFLARAQLFQERAWAFRSLLRLPPPLSSWTAEFASHKAVPSPASEPPPHADPAPLKRRAAAESARPWSTHTATCHIPDQLEPLAEVPAAMCRRPRRRPCLLPPVRQTMTPLTISLPSLVLRSAFPTFVTPPTLAGATPQLRSRPASPTFAQGCGRPC